MSEVRVTTAAATVDTEGVSELWLAGHFALGWLTDQLCAVANSNHVGSVEHIEPDEDRSDQESDTIRHELSSAV
jgi:hypothetical protein